MAVELDAKLLRQVVTLSRLKLSPEEMDNLGGSLREILSYVGKLDELDTANVEPMTHPLELRNVFRNDDVKPSLSPDEALANAPDREGNFFRVPKVIE
jgi:aspartyl-tRNA(Asn)/glutamyl-tRNA(Gln) amidotransferase subunit C